MSVYAISDPHLSLSVEKPMDVFGGRWTDYTEKLKNSISGLKGSDTVVMAGDISWGMTTDEAKPDIEFLNSLPAYKILGKGNHDYWWSTMAKLEKFRKENGFENIGFLFNNAYAAEDMIICGSRGWYLDAEVKGCDNRLIVARECGRLELSLKAGEKLGEEKDLGKPVVFLHYPPIYGDYRCDEIMDVLKSHGVEKCCFGHLHGVDGSRIIEHSDGIDFALCSADFLNFKPMRIN